MTNIGGDVRILNDEPQFVLIGRVVAVGLPPHGVVPGTLWEVEGSSCWHWVSCWGAISVPPGHLGPSRAISGVPGCPDLPRSAAEGDQIYDLVSLFSPELSLT